MLVTVPSHRLVIWGTRNVDVLLIVLQESREELSSDSSEKVGKSWALTGLSFCNGNAATGGFDLPVAIEESWEQCQYPCSPPGCTLARQAAVSKPFWAAVADLGVDGVLRAGNSSVVSPGKGCSGGCVAGRGGLGGQDKVNSHFEYFQTLRNMK